MMVARRCDDHHDDKDADGDNKNVHDPARRMHVPTPKIESSSEQLARCAQNETERSSSCFSTRASFNAWCFRFEGRVRSLKFKV